MPPNYRTPCIFMFGLLLSLGGCQQDVGNTTSKAPELSRSEQPPSLKPPKAGPALEAFAEITDVNAKKTAFFDYLQPQIEQENIHSGKLKEHFSILQALLKKQGQLHPADADWLNRVAKLYSVDAEEPAQQLELLNAKVDSIPSALVKAQAANESAWGTSRFALEANNLFGQWCFTPGCGVTPLQRNPDDTHEVQSFPSVAAGLRSYFVNLNGNRSYASLRQIRRCMQSNEQPYSGRALAAGLVNYSARGGHYVEELQAMIRINKLEDWNGNWWGDTDSDHPCYSLVQVETDLPDPVKTNDGTETETETEPTLLPAEQEATVEPGAQTESIPAAAVTPVSNPVKQISEPATTGLPTALEAKVVADTLTEPALATSTDLASSAATAESVELMQPQTETLSGSEISTSPALKTVTTEQLSAE